MSITNSWPIFRNLTPYYLRELLGDNVNSINLSKVCDKWNTTNEDINKIIDSDKIELQFYKLYPLFEDFKMQGEFGNTDFKILNKKYWELLKKGELPTNFDNSSSEDLKFWMKHFMNIESITDISNLKEILSKNNHNLNDAGIPEIYDI